jgi:hypothetical protein
MGVPLSRLTSPAWRGYSLARFVMTRQAHIYLPEDDRPAIVAPMHYNAAGIYYEQADPIVVASWRDAAAIAGALRSALQQFVFRDLNLRDHKKTDWPSYRASGCRSVREFEKLFLRMAVSAINEAELFYDVKAQPRGEAEITLHVTLNRYSHDDEFAQPLLRLFDACCKWSSSQHLSV